MVRVIVSKHLASTSHEKRKENTTGRQKPLCDCFGLQDIDGCIQSRIQEKKLKSCRQQWQSASNQWWQLVSSRESQQPTENHWGIHIFPQQRVVISHPIWQKTLNHCEHVMCETLTKLCVSQVYCSVSIVLGFTVIVSDLLPFLLLCRFMCRCALCSCVTSNQIKDFYSLCFWVLFLPDCYTGM